MKKPPLIWKNILVFLMTTIMAVVAVPLYGYFVGYENWQWVAMFIGIMLCGFSITAGYHRLWSHKSYDSSKILQAIFAVMGAFALQNSILHWASDHRRHHKFVDQNGKDPYSAKQGFWFSHIGWMLREYQNDIYHDYSNARDLQKNRIVMWQHQHYLSLVLLTNFGIPISLGLLFGDVIGTVLLVGFLRLVINHHVTFFINSLAHIWGTRPYTKTNTARDNGFLALLTYGEGYHNFHHHFEYDYRNGVRWWQFDPTKWLIYGCSKIGLATNLRRCSEQKIEEAKARNLLYVTKSKLVCLPENHLPLEMLYKEYDSLIEKLNNYYSIKTKFLESKRQHLLKQYQLSDLYKQMQELKFRFSEQKKYWEKINQTLLLQPN